jgi:hypothetical protein
MKTAYQTDADGFFTGTAQADLSPLEPGVWLVPGGCVEVEPPSLTEGQKAQWVNGAWVVVSPPPEPDPESEPEPTLEEKAEMARSDRNGRLRVSDWTQISDATVDAAAWRVYRQALRDVPQQAGFPETIVWPEQPQ